MSLLEIIIEGMPVGIILGISGVAIICVLDLYLKSRSNQQLLKQDNGDQ